MTLLQAHPPAMPPAVPAAGVGTPRRPGRLLQVGLVLLVWVVIWKVFNGTATLPLDASDLTPLHHRLNDARDWVDLNRNSNPLFLYGFNEIRAVLDGLTNALRALLAVPALGLPIPVLGWLGVVAVATFGAWLFGNLKVAALTAAGLCFVGLQGLWTQTMDTLALTLAAVLVSLLLGIPLGVSAGLNDRFQTVITPVLDFMQTMPTFVYLAPLALFFGIGPASAVIATLIYAMPPVVRLTAHGIRSVPRAAVEASESLGSTRAQSLTKVLLPMAQRTIVLGVNQTVMAALSMVTIAALISAPGLGAVVIHALQISDVGLAFNAGVALVILAVILDRVTTAAAARTAIDAPRRSAGGLVGRLVAHRRYLALAAGLVTAVLVYLSRTYVWAATFPSRPTLGGVDRDLGQAIVDGANSTTGWIKETLPGLTDGLKDQTTTWVIDPLQGLLADTPWWGTAAAIIALAAVVGGLRAAVTAVAGLALILVTGLWQDAMVTLAATLVATLVVVLLGVVFGVWMGRSQAADRAIRPLLDAGQVMPPFVYLVPFVALFAASRFSGIAAAVVFASPVAIKIVADGIRGVSATTVEAATAAGSSTWQVIRKVQLPMASSALTLATNQGLIYVLSMVVVGGLVGGGALGFDVVEGFSKSELFGKGLAAGMAIVLLGIMLDRITQAAARRGARPGR
jgi:glycine betaine/proline transport system permease protein